MDVYCTIYNFIIECWGEKSMWLLLWKRVNGFQLSQTWNTTEYNNVGLLSSHYSLSTYVYYHLLSQPSVIK